MMDFNLEFISSFMKTSQVFAMANLLFLILDVCLPAWDFISDLKVVIQYWSNSDFNWVKFRISFIFDFILVFCISDSFLIFIFRMNLKSIFRTQETIKKFNYIFLLFNFILLLKKIIKLIVYVSATF